MSGSPPCTSALANDVNSSRNSASFIPAFMPATVAPSFTDARDARRSLRYVSRYVLPAPAATVGSAALRAEAACCSSSIATALPSARAVSLAGAGSEHPRTCTPPKFCQDGSNLLNPCDSYSFRAARGPMPPPSSAACSSALVLPVPLWPCAPATIACVTRCALPLAAMIQRCRVLAAPAPNPRAGPVLTFAFVSISARFRLSSS